MPDTFRTRVAPAGPRRQKVKGATMMLGLGLVVALAGVGAELIPSRLSLASASEFRRYTAAAMSMCRSAFGHSREQTFLAANNAAMMRMMAAMDAAPSGDIDADFVNMMEPHHQGAIDMAILQLRYGKNPQLRRLAQEIIIDQRQEIDAMRLALGRPLQPPAAAPTQVTEQKP